MAHALFKGPTFTSIEPQYLSDLFLGGVGVSTTLYRNTLHGFSREQKPFLHKVEKHVGNQNQWLPSLWTVYPHFVEALLHQNMFVVSQCISHWLQYNRHRRMAPKKDLVVAISTWKMTMCLCSVHSWFTLPWCIWSKTLCKNKNVLFYSGLCARPCSKWLL